MKSDLPKQQRFSGTVFASQHRQFSRSKFKIDRSTDAAFIGLREGKRELGNMSLLRVQIVLEVVLKLKNVLVDEKLRGL